MSTSRRLSAVAAATLGLAALLAPVPAHAQGTARDATGPSQSSRCPLERVGDHWVRCDDVTGDGQHAPDWIAVWEPGPVTVPSPLACGAPWMRARTGTAP